MPDKDFKKFVKNIEHDLKLKNALLQTIINSAELKNIISSSIKYVKSYIQFEYMSMYFVDKNKNTLKNYYSFNVIKGRKCKPTIPDEITIQDKDNFLVKCLKTGKIVVLDKINSEKISDTRLLNFVSEYNLKNLFLLPLSNKKSVYCLILFYNLDSGFEFEENLILNIIEFYNNINQSIYNAYNLKNLEKQTNKLNILLKHVNSLSLVSAKINSSFDTGEILDEIITALVELFNFETISIFLKDTNKQVLECTKFFSKSLSKKTVSSLQGRVINLTNNKSLIVKAFTENRWLYEKIIDTETQGCLLISPLIARNKTIGVITMSSPENLNLEELEIKMVLNFAYQVANAINNSLLYKDLNLREENLKKALDELAKHDEMSKHINSSLDIDEIFNITVSELQKLYRFGSFSLLLVDQTRKQYTIKKIYSENTEINNLLDKIGYNFEISSNNADLVSKCILENKTFFINDVDLDKESNVLNKSAAITLKMKSLLILPLSLPDKVIGAINIINHKSCLNFDENDIKTIKRFTAHIVYALHNSNLYRQISEKNILLEEKDKIISLDLEMAKKIQSRVLTSDIPEIDSFNVVIEYTPMQKVGGDLYDIRKLSPNHVRILVADMTGHGIQASLTTMLLKAEYEKINNSFLDPYEVLQLLNHEYIRHYHNLNIFFTAFVIDIYPDKNKIIFCSGGHPEQIYIPKSGKFQTLITGGRLLGAKDDAVYIQKELTYEPGDKLILFTDGIFEQFNEQKELFGEERVYSYFDTMRGNSLDQIHSGFLEKLYNFTGNNDINDDITLISIEFK